MAILGLGISAITLIPSIEFVKHSVRFIPDFGLLESITRKMPYNIFTQHSVDHLNLKGLYGADVQWFNIGVSSSLLFFISFFVKKVKDQPVFNFALLLFVFSFSYSITFFFTDIMYYLPVYNAVREPFLYAPFVGISAGILAAFTLKFLLEKQDNSASINFIKGSFYNNIVFIAMVVLTTIVILLPHNKSLQYYVIAIPVILSVIYLLFFSSRYMVNFKIVYFTTLCLFLFSLTFSVITSANKNKTIWTPKNISGQVDKVVQSTKLLFADDAPTEKDPWRILSWTAKGQAYSSSIMGIIGYYDFMAYWNPVQAKQVKIHLSWSLEKRASIMNIKYIVFTDKEDENFIKGFTGMKYKEVRRVSGVYPSLDAQETNTVIIYETPEHNGPAWTVDNYITYNTQTPVDEIHAKINDINFVASKVALINTDTLDFDLSKIDNVSANSSVEVLKYTPNSMSVKVVTNKPTLLVTSEKNYNGWRTYVNGSKVKTTEVNYAFRGVPLDKGEHIVEFKYLSTTFVIGLVITILSIIGAISLIVYGYVKLRKS